MTAYPIGAGVQAGSIGHLTILFLPIVLAWVVLHGAWIGWRRVIRARHWMVTEARVVSVSTRPDLLKETAPLWAGSVVNLEYRALAQPFSSRQALSGRLTIEPGNRILLRYNPDDPRQAVVEEPAGLVLAALFREAVAGLFVAAALAAVVDSLTHMGVPGGP